MNAGFVSDIFESQDLEIVETLCDLTAVFENIKILDRTSNTTVQVFATLKSKEKTQTLFSSYFEDGGTKSGDVFINIGFPTGDDSVVAERIMYEQLTPLLWDMRTPNIARYVASFECDDFHRFLINKNVFRTNNAVKNRYHSNLLERVENLMEEEHIDPKRAIITVLEKGDGMSLHDLLGKGLRRKDFLDIMFQTFYTLRELFLNNINRNNTHLENIWINVLPEPQRMIYFVSDDIYVTIETKYVVKIYVFDSASFTVGPMSNTIAKTDICPKYGVCENQDERFNIAILLIELGEWGKRYDFVSDFTKTIFHTNVSDRSKPSRVYNLAQIIVNTDVFVDYTRRLSIDGFKKSDIPSKRVIHDGAIPMYVFRTKIYVSTKCKLSPIEMANILVIGEVVLHNELGSPKKMLRKRSPSSREEVSEGSIDGNYAYYRSALRAVDDIRLGAHREDIEGVNYYTEKNENP